MTVQRLRETAPGPGFRATDAGALKPFLSLTLFSMSQATFRPHPHAGFSAVTYMLPESEGSFVNRDSGGDHRLIRPGDIHWTQAGRGIVHEEVPQRPGTVCRGFQIFVDLAPEHELLAPQRFHANAADIPRVDDGAAQVRVLVGRHGTQPGALRGLATDVSLFDLTLAAGAEFVFQPAQAQAWGFCFEGTVGADGAAALDAPLLLRAGQAQTPLLLRAGPRGARLLLGSGTPGSHGKHWSGPLAMSTPQRLQAAQAAWRNGDFGPLSPSF